jgi:hypothetical protein|tara:strand:+ start:471 stop:608 length:138 start_codon:yes stop_codon:yes gene_type:complete
MSLKGLALSFYSEILSELFETELWSFWLSSELLSDCLAAFYFSFA